MNELRIFYYPEPVRSNSRIVLKDSDYHHMKEVLRLMPGDQISIVTVSGRYRAVIRQYTNHTAEVLIQEVMDKRENDYKIILWQCILKGNKMDDLLDKVTEMGVSEIVPVISERTIPVQPFHHEIPEKVNRWQRKIVAASKQSRRDFVPSISSPVPLFLLLESQSSSDSVNLFFWECAEKQDILKVLQHNHQSRKIVLLLGPEGGFSQTEAITIIQSGFHPVSLGPTILRAENAGFFAIGLVRYLLSPFVS